MEKQLPLCSHSAYPGSWALGPRGQSVGVCHPVPAFQVRSSSVAFTQVPVHSMRGLWDNSRPEGVPLKVLWSPRLQTLGCS